MALQYLVMALLVMSARAEADAKSKAVPGAKPEAAIIGHHGAAFVTPAPHFPPHGPPYHQPTYTPSYGHGLTPALHVTPIPVIGHSVTPAYGHVTPGYGHHHPAPHSHCGYEKAPLCSYNTTKPWCLSDYEYPEYEIKAALAYHKAAVLPLYVDVADLSTLNSVARPKSIYDETYLCPSETGYVRPLRSVNTDGKWRVIVNNIKLDYEVFTQTTRIEECLTYDKGCPLVPHCYESKCLQKSIYHRFLVYDPCDHYFPFAIETFKLPASCACLLGGYYLQH